MTNADTSALIKTPKANKEGMLKQVALLTEQVEDLTQKLVFMDIEDFLEDYFFKKGQRTDVTKIRFCYNIQCLSSEERQQKNERFRPESLFAQIQLCR